MRTGYFRQWNVEEPKMVPHTLSLSALSLLRPPHLHDQPALPSHLKQEDSGLAALERRLVEQVRSRRLSPFSTDEADPPPPPIPTSERGKEKAARSGEELGSAGTALNESAILSLALVAEEDFGGRNVNLLLAAPEGDVEDVELGGEDVDADADGRTQRLSKGAGASSNSKEREKDREKNGEVEDAKAEQDTRSPSLAYSSLETEPALDPTPAPELTVSAEERSPVVESKRNRHSCGFISVATLRHAPISLPPPSAPESTPIHHETSFLCEMKYYYVKSARGGHGGRVAVAASMWACKRGGPSATTQAAKTKAQPKAAAASTPKPALVKPMTSITTEPPARTSEAKAEEEDASPRMQYALFGLHTPPSLSRPPPQTQSQPRPLLLRTGGRRSSSKDKLSALLTAAKNGNGNLDKAMRYLLDSDSTPDNGAWVTHNALTQWIRKLKAGSLLPHFNIFDRDNHCPCRQQRALIIPNVTYRSHFHPIWGSSLMILKREQTEATVAAEVGIATPISSSFPSKRWWLGGEKGWASDAGWGRTLGTGHPSLATALIHLHLRQDWRSAPQPVYTIDYAIQLPTISWDNRRASTCFTWTLTTHLPMQIFLRCVLGIASAHLFSLHGMVLALAYL
ncbi:hypothetical protein EI94DRAFT_1701680 [Lactarius quietus]|nr:hypothetical protein EI94DRAFT_1701680 [Lactarius quietus]